MTEPAPPARSLGTLVSTLADDFRVLLQQEIELAKGEIRDSVRGVVAASIALIAAAAFLFVGLLVLLAFLVLGLGVLLGGAYWLSALIIGGATTLVGVFLGRSGAKRLGSTGLTPEQTLDSVRESAEWLRTEIAERREGPR